MKKYKFYIIVAIIAMIIPILYQIFVKHHEVSYQVNNYEIQETMEVGKTHQYTFHIKKKKEEYSFIIEQDMHKKKKVITDIKVYQQEEVICIVPIYKVAAKKDIYCRIGKIQVSKEMLKENKAFQKIAKKAKISLSKESTIKQDYKNMSVYLKNITADEAIIIWDYKGIVVLKRDKKLYQPFLDYDLYDNVMATTNSKYFVLLENTSVNGIDTIHCYDLEKEKYKVITLEEKIAKDSYINGVYKDLIYITDSKAKKQYTLNVKKEELKEVGNEENDYIVWKNQEKTLLGKSDFFSQKQFFGGENYQEEEKEILKVNHMSYWQEDDTFYQKIDSYNPIALWKLDGVEKWDIIQEEWIIKKEDTLYLYEKDLGLRKILEYNELKYNDNNIYYLWK